MSLLFAALLLVSGCSNPDDGGSHVGGGAVVEAVGPLPAEMVPTVESLRIPSSGTDEETGRAVVDRLTAWINAGASAEVYEHYDGSISVGAFAHEVVAQMQPTHVEALFTDEIVASSDISHQEFLRKAGEFHASNLTLHYSTLESRSDRPNEEPYSMGYEFRELLGSESEGAALNLLISADFVHNGDRNVVGLRYGDTRQPVELHVILEGGDYLLIDYYEVTFE
ncbi:hypothetical protein BJ994_000050 [Arthrobacter pigmenti]|uniref:Uncharacterized protein n=1 Tax=Arthrobacter pigmenti TaxID=271432 RepID=A0A846RL27_9MICC|nr:hypothetical protein [Arthrobacter pigmenti]NJC20974.1 hypothetical protein [Arthrobacter pigmenti]